MSTLMFRSVTGPIAITTALALVPTATQAAFDSYGDEATWRVAAGTTQLENFESYAVDTQLTSLPGLGISFAELAGGGYPVIYEHSEPEVTPHGAKHLGNFPNGTNAINQYASIVLMPQSGLRLTALGFYNGDGQPDAILATAYDSNDLAVGSISAFKGAFAGFVSSSPIARVVFDGNTGDGWNHIDGLQTSTAPIPEPSTLSMLAIGLLAFRALRRSPLTI